MELLRFEAHRGKVQSIAFSKDGTRLLTVGEEGTARVWETITGKELVAVRARSPGLVTPDGSSFVVLPLRADEQALRVLDPASGKEQRRIDMTASSTLCAAFSPDGLLLATGHDDGRIRIWEFATGRLVRALRFPSGDSTVALAWSPDGQVLAAPSRAEDPVRRLPDFQINLWSPLTGKRLRVISGHLESVKTLAFSPDGEFLVSAGTGKDRLIRVREVANGEEVIQLPASGRSPIPLAFSPDGKLMASWNNHEEQQGKTVRVWETTEWKEVALLRIPPKGTDCLVFSADGSRLAVGKHDGWVAIWDVRGLHALAVPKPRKLGADELNKLWEDMVLRDGPKGRKIINSLIAGGADSVAFLAGRVQPAPVVDPKWIGEQIDRLDSDDLATRQKAFTALEQAADDAGPMMKEAAARPAISAEVRKRLDELLAIPGPIKSPEALRRVRTVDVLERIGSDAAQELLRKLMEGNPKAPETVGAKRALDRITTRKNRE